MAEEIRVQKYLSQAGVASRREAERLMAQGRVQVNGEVVTELGRKVVPGRDVVLLDGAVVEPRREIRWIAFHKPPGVLTTRSDPHGGRTVYDVLPREMGDLRYVGRLDRETEGLLLLSNEGDVIHGLLHPSREVEREYRALVAGRPGPGVLRRLTGGVSLEDGMARARRVQVVETRGRDAVLDLVLTEGRKREVRRLLREVGLPVRRLVRVRFGPIELGRLAPGAWRPLSERERHSLELLARGGGEHGKA
ncbi:MAG: pseudouridine synthase [Gemmatimonadota bacterium]